MQSGAVLLHDHTGDDILIRLLQFRQYAEAGLHHRAGPVVYLVVLVRIAADSGLDGFLDDFAHIVHDKLVLFAAIIHCGAYLLRRKLVEFRTKLTKKARL